MTEPQAAAPAAPAPLLTPAALAAAVCGLTLLCGTLVALYALAPHRPDVAPLFAALPGVIGAIGVTVVGMLQRASHRETTQQLAVITHQTNGVLTQKIGEQTKAAVTAALAERRATDAPPPAPVVLQVAPAPAELPPVISTGTPPDPVSPDGGA